MLQLAAFVFQVPPFCPADLHALRNGGCSGARLGHEHLVHAVDVVLENGLVLAAVQREHELIRGKGNGREEKGRRRVDTAAPEGRLFGCTCR